MALRTISRPFSLNGRIGKRDSEPQRPSNEAAYFVGAGLASQNRASCSGISLSCKASAVVKSPLRQADWNSVHSLGATLDVTEMQPCPPCAMKPSDVASS